MALKGEYGKSSFIAFYLGEYGAFMPFSKVLGHRLLSNPEGSFRFMFQCYLLAFALSSSPICGSTKGNL